MLLFFNGGGGEIGGTRNERKVTNIWRKRTSMSDKVSDRDDRLTWVLTFYVVYIFLM